jgi:hypothetical protein
VLNYSEGLSSRSYPLASLQSAEAKRASLLGGAALYPRVSVRNNVSDFSGSTVAAAHLRILVAANSGITSRNSRNTGECMVLGEIVGESETSRLQLLGGLFKSTFNRDLVFVVAGEERPAEIIIRADGVAPDEIVELDVRPRIRVPSSDMDSWTIDNCSEAFDALAQASVFEDYPLLAPPLAAIQLTRMEFMNWLSRRALELPTFWSEQRLTKKQRSDGPSGFFSRFRQ